MLQAKDLLSGISKGTAKTKLQIYRTLLIQHFHDVTAVNAMEEKLVTEPDLMVFASVRYMDQSGGPRLDWTKILSRRVIECKSNKGRDDALKNDHSYGPDTRNILSRVALEDEVEQIRERAFKVLCGKNEGSTDLYFLELARKLMTADLVSSREQVVGPLWILGETSEMFDLMANELEENPLLSPVSIAGLLNKHNKRIPHLFDRVKELCREEFGEGPDAWRDIDVSRTGQGYALLKVLNKIHNQWSPYSPNIDFSWDNDFAIYLTDLVDGPVNAVLGDTKDYAKALGSYLSYMHNDRDVAYTLLMRLLHNNNIPENPRFWILSGYANSQKLRGIGMGEFRQSIEDVLTDENPELLQMSERIFNPDVEALEREEQDRLKRVRIAANKKICETLVKFISAYASDDDRVKFAAPALKEIREQVSLNGQTLLNFICSYADDNEARYFIIKDGDDVGLARHNIDRSREALGLSFDDEIYENDNDHSAPVDKQYQIYANYLKTKGYCLVDVDMGWDSLCAVVISQENKSEFEMFIKDNLPDLFCQFL